jgi:small neutral amino acid transporter SnatA (MarC family)
VKTVLYVVVAVDAFGAYAVVARLRDRTTTARAAWVTAALLLGLACVAGPWLLDRLDISAEAAQIAAGAVLAVPALTLLVFGDQLFLVGDAAGGRARGVVPVAVPLLAGPAPWLVVAASAARHGRGDAVIGVAVALALSALALAAASRFARDKRSVAEGVAGRCVGAAMVFVAFALVADGVLAI